LESLAGPLGLAWVWLEGQIWGQILGSILEGHLWDLLAHWVFGSLDNINILVTNNIICLLFTWKDVNNIPTPNSGNGDDMGLDPLKDGPWPPEGLK